MTKEWKIQRMRATCYKDEIRNLTGNAVDLKTDISKAALIENTPPAMLSGKSIGEW